jgi:uncharacterized protein YkwD
VAWAVFSVAVTAVVVDTSMGTVLAQADRSPSAQSPLSPEQVELIEAHNRERAAANLPPLAANPKLMAAATLHARDMAEHEMMSHEGTDGSTPQERIARQGYHGRRTGENVAAGQRTVAEVMREWMNSPHHRENILGDFDEIGVAVADSAEGIRYWCAAFGLSWPKLDRDRAASQLVEALNRARTKAGRPPLKVSPKLGEAAQKLARELASRGDLNALNRPGEPSSDQLVLREGYRFSRLGEAAAMGQAKAEDVVKSWLDSPSQREQFLGEFSEVGVGYATTKDEVPVWVVFLAEPEAG